LHILLQYGRVLWEIKLHFTQKKGLHKLQLFYNLHVVTAVDTFFPMPESGCTYFGGWDFVFQMHLPSILWIKYTFYDKYDNGLVKSWIESRCWMFFSCDGSSFQAAVGCRMILLFLFGGINSLIWSLLNRIDLFNEFKSHITCWISL